MPVLTVIAGPNGSGKSTLIAALRSHGVEFGQYFNADDIAVTLVGDPVEVAREAQEVVRSKRAKALADGIDHSFETVMSHVSHIDYMRSARSRGFEVRLYFVATDKPEINVGRVANRVVHGGHDVPTDRIVSRYHRCLANLPSAIAASDRAAIFDNSQVGQSHRLIAKIVHGQLEHTWNGLFGTLLQVLAELDASDTADLENIPPGWLKPLLAIYALELDFRDAVDFKNIPSWWLRILLEIKRLDPFEDGPLG